MDDMISRQAAINRATKEHDFYRGADTVSDKARRDELLNVMCWLGELPSAQPEDAALHESCTDCPLYDHDKHRCPRFNKVIPTTIQEIQDTQPKMRGKWVYNSPVTMKCDQCGFVVKDWDWHRFNFCPNCRADMREE